MLTVILAPISPSHVLGMGDGFHVGRIDTGAITAEVVDAESIGDRTDQGFVDDTVRPAFS